MEVYEHRKDNGEIDDICQQQTTEVGVNHDDNVEAL
jgi:hypothetical protein